MKKVIIPGILVVAGIIIWGITRWTGGATTGFRFVLVDRGDVETVVSSTGTLQAIKTVEVGTQVSGQIAEIYVDYNDSVTEGQLIARIDPTILEQEVRAAEASLERSRAQLLHAEREWKRIEQLYERKVTTEQEYNSAQYEYQVAQASYKSSEISLARAERNLGYSEIRAPIDGVILTRAVDAGQTVAASFSAPQLFLIAEDLSAMEILAYVDESDIGQINEGQEVRFTVQAYPDEAFSGTVDQVRLQSTTQENVVNYAVAISVPNPDGRLLPGMTATAEFIVARAENVLRVPNAGLRFRPTEELLAQVHRRGAPRDSTRRGRRQMSASPAERAMLWYVDENNEVHVAPVRKGISDDQYTEITGDDVQEGMQVIAAVTSSTSSTAVNPFQSQSPRGRRRGPPPRM